jgi:hypothetical protein
MILVVDGFGVVFIEVCGSSRRRPGDRSVGLLEGSTFRETSDIDCRRIPAEKVALASLEARC